jgi:hypothetical protein
MNLPWHQLNTRPPELNGPKLAGISGPLKPMDDGGGAPQSGNIRYTVISQVLKWQHNWQQSDNRVATLRTMGLDWKTES